MKRTRVTVCGKTQFPFHLLSDCEAWPVGGRDIGQMVWGALGWRLVRLSMNGVIKRHEWEAHGWQVLEEETIYLPGIANPKPATFRFAVHGRGSFPSDMLRRDACWPASPSDGSRISASLIPGAGVPDDRAPRQVVLVSRQMPTPARWRSFGWELVMIQRGDAK